MAPPRVRADRVAGGIPAREVTAAGATTLRPPGEYPEYHPGYYGAFVADPDGINVEAVCHAPSGSD